MSSTSARQSASGVVRAAAPANPRRATTSVALPVRKTIPAMTSIEDFRAAASLDIAHTQPSLCPAFQSMEAFKTRRTFLNGQQGFDLPSGTDCDDVGDEEAWLQSVESTAAELSELCAADYDKPPHVQRLCKQLEEERTRLQQQANPDSASDTDEDDEIY